MKEQSSYAWVAMPTRGRDIICVYGGTTSQTVEKRTSGGYGPYLKKDDLLIIHDEPVDFNIAGSDRWRQMTYATNWSEQLVIDTCRAVALQLGKEGYFIDCVNDKEAVSKNDRGSYDRWIDEGRGGETIDKDLFKKMIQKIKMLACATYNVAFDKERENKLLIRELRGELLKATQRLDRVQYELNRTLRGLSDRDKRESQANAWAYISEKAETIAEWICQDNPRTPAMIRRGKTISWKEAKDAAYGPKWEDHDKTEDYIKLLSGGFHSCDGVVGYQPCNEILDHPNYMPRRLTLA
ncbi:MAG: hypothetical protein CMI54_00320 [Parcubacteria group bacterium]|nr:hypothetical protein [Parcubacteria group bacterium]|tara:strand:- start:583 stop:1467 length:885 start_codon:yes stop_codon:yes gene_type:complete